MKIFAISDLHLDINNKKPMDIFGPVWENYLDSINKSWDKLVNSDDIVLLCGDYSWAMKLNEAIPDFDFLREKKGKKILIRGNHDYWWQTISNVRKILPENTYALQNDAIKIGEYIFCGNRGWLFPEGKFNTDENKKIFAREVERTKLSLQSAKKLQNSGEKIVFMMHFPPFNHKVEKSVLTDLFEEYNVSAVVFGHLHGYINKKMLFNEISGIKYYLTSCDALKNKLIEIDT